MEIAGKLLSILLVTFLGAVTTIVYVLEYENEPYSSGIFLENESTVTKDELEISKYREQLRDFKPINVPDRDNYMEKAPLWGEQPSKQDYYVNISKEADQAADDYSLEIINKEMKYWSDIYKSLLKHEGNKQLAKRAYIKYKIFKEAARIKSTQ